MRYWWVSQNQTHREEVPGGLLWPPKRNANGAGNPFYDTMTEVISVDVVFSYYDAQNQATGWSENQPNRRRSRRSLRVGRVFGWEITGRCEAAP
ncbi:MAG: hypothetical protein RL238_3297 [Actinomycetota bacterium]|jgi:hypothetical protein